jgi:hypothetical protein
MSIDELKNALASPFRFNLEWTHRATIILAASIGKVDPALEVLSGHAQAAFPIRIK